MRSTSPQATCGLRYRSSAIHDEVAEAIALVFDDTLNCDLIRSQRRRSEYHVPKASRTKRDGFARACHACTEVPQSAWSFIQSAPRPNLPNAPTHKLTVASAHQLIPLLPSIPTNSRCFSQHEQLEHIPHARVSDLPCGPVFPRLSTDF
jgi:hypothetical protein